MVSFNATSNLITEWHDPFSIMFSTPVQPHPPSAAGSAAALLGPGDADILRARKASTAGSPAGQPAQRQLPALAYSLERLHLGENQFKDDIAKQVAGYLRELVVLNLSFNEIGELPLSFFKYQSHLEELYLSGNKLTNFPTENLERLGKLSTLFLNGNKLQTLPAELGKVQTLTTLDVGSNQLKYNINNSEYDWNW
jgi:adenylate cyclase